MNYFPSLIILIITFVITSIMHIVFKINRRKRDNDSETDKQEMSDFSFIRHMLIGIIWLIGLGASAAFIPELKSISTSIFAGSGILAVVLGFASQQAFSNLIGGLFITMFKPFKKNDIVRFIDKDIIGKIEDITLRHTIINNFENKRIIIPNSVISSEIIENFNIIDKKICNHFSVNISYDSDIDKAIEIIKDEVLKHPDYIDIRSKKQKLKNIDAVPVKLFELGESGPKLKAWVWAVNPIIGYQMMWSLNYSIKKRFDEEGIKFSYPYTNIVLNNK